MNEVLLRQNMQSLQSTLSVCIHVETHLHAILREFHSRKLWQISVLRRLGINSFFLFFLNDDLKISLREACSFYSVNHISRIFMKLFLIHVMILSRFLHFPNSTPTLKFLKEGFLHNATKYPF